ARLPWGATLVVVSGVITDSLLATLLRLHEVGRRLVLVSLAEQVPDPLVLPPGIIVHHLPASEIPYDDSLIDEAEEWNTASVSEFAPPIRFTGAVGE
ncbi:MAG: hypothetical protein ACK2U9_22815, partial [Anaerolineae bacterium]